MSRDLSPWNYIGTTDLGYPLWECNGCGMVVGDYGKKLHGHP